MHDFTVITKDGISINVEVKTVRNGIKPKVELQKTRAAKSDPSSRYYGRNHFDVLAVCMGRHSGDWSEFRYALARDIPAHKDYPDKLQVMNTIQDGDPSMPHWFSRLQDLIDAY